MSHHDFASLIQLPELICENFFIKNETQCFVLKKIKTVEYCRKCASECHKTYDHRIINIVDVPVRGRTVTLKIKKRRLYCDQCGHVFTESIPGIKKSWRTTERLHRHALYLSQKYKCLKQVAKEIGCSQASVHKFIYKQIELEQRKVMNNPWDTTIGLDEHAFNKRGRYGRKEMVSIFVEHTRGRVRELVLETRAIELSEDPFLRSIPGREQVKNVIMDFSEGYRKFSKSFFPNAKITVDRFHCIQLFHRIINKERGQFVKDKRMHIIPRLLLSKGRRLKYEQRRLIQLFLQKKESLSEVYIYKERMHAFYDIRGKKRAKKALIKLLDDMSYSKNPLIKTLRKTLLKWSREVMNFFDNKLTNGRTEGFNRKAKLIQRNAFGFRSFKNYRLKMLHECR